MNLLITAPDHALGRLDYDGLSEQGRMEILIDGACPEFKAIVSDENMAFKDVAEWPGVTSNADGHITEIEIDYEIYEAMDGTAHLDFLPPNLTNCDMAQMKARGTLETAKLPQNLIKFAIDLNYFHGVVDFSALPKNIELFNIAYNNFSGSCDLTKLPETLKHILLSSNRFSGEVNLTNLPPQMEIIFLSSNNFTGELCLDYLPETLEELFLHKNKFSGKFQLLQPPQALQELDAHGNSFAETAVLSSAVGDIGRMINVTLYACNIERIVDENGEAHKEEKSILSDHC